MTEAFEALKRVVDAFQEQNDAAKAKAQEIPLDQRCYVPGSFSGWTFMINDLLPEGHLQVSRDVFESLQKSMGINHGG